MSQFLIKQLGTWDVMRKFVTTTVGPKTRDRANTAFSLLGTLTMGMKCFLLPEFTVSVNVYGK